MLRLVFALVSLLASDSFTRANANPIGAPWITTSGESAMQIVSNACTPSTLATDCGAYNSSVAWPADQWVRAKLAVTGTAGSTAGARLKLRQASAANTAYILAVDHAATNNVAIQKTVAGVFTTLTGFPVTLAWTDGDLWELRAQGTLISVYRNGAFVGSATDNAIASGNAALGYSSVETAVSITAWEAGDFSGGAPVSNPLPLGRFMRANPSFNTSTPIAVVANAFRRTLHPFGAGKGKRTRVR